MRYLVYTLGTLAILLLLHAGAYFALVVRTDRAYPAEMVGGGHFLACRIAEYRIGGDYAASFFGLMHMVDSRWLRRGSWFFAEPIAVPQAP